MPTILALVPMGSRSQPSSRSGRVPSSVDVAEDVEGNIDSSNLSTSFIQLFPSAPAMNPAVSTSDFASSSLVKTIISSEAAEGDASKGGRLFVSTVGEVARISRNKDSMVASSTALCGSALTELGESCGLYPLAPRSKGDEKEARPPAAGPKRRNPHWSPSVLDGEWYQALQVPANS